MTNAELADVRDGCPCTVEGIEPCRSSCSCANWAMSGGCDRCAKYGSLEQRQRAARQIIAALRRSERDPMEDFRKGRESVLRKNQSGCCCLFNEEDEVVSVCMAHKEWAERQPSSDQVPRDIGELAQNMVATMNRQPGYKLAITHGRILKIAQEVCRLYELSKLAAAEAEGNR